MTLSEIRTYVTNFTTDFQLDNCLAASPSDTQLTSLVNWAIRTFSVKSLCNFDHEITLTLVANQAVYDCRDVTAPAVVSRKILHPYFVTINGNPLLRPDMQSPGFWPYQQLVDYNRSYQTEASAVPSRAVWLPGNQLLLSPPPTAAVLSAGENYITANYIAANMTVVTDDSNSPDIPEEYHECLAFLAAFKAAMPRAAEQEAWASLKA